MRVVVAVAAMPFRSTSDATRAAGLCAAFRADGVEAEIVPVPFSPTPPSGIAAQLLACRLLDLSESMGTAIDRFIGIGLPASAIAHPYKVLWDGGSRSVAEGWPGAAETQAMLAHAGQQVAAESHTVFATSHLGASRIARHWHREATTLYQPPPLAPLCRNDPAGRYLLVEGLRQGERLTLLLEALHHTRLPVHLLATLPRGQAEGMEQTARARQLGADRISFVTQPAPGQLATLIAAARAVVFAGHQCEETGIALAAMLCLRPLVAPTDAGAPLEFIAHGRTGLTCEPTPHALADALDTIWGDPRGAGTMGHEAWRCYQDMALSWEAVTRCLLASA